MGPRACLYSCGKSHPAAIRSPDLCWAEILKLIVNSLARFIQKRTGKRVLTFVVEEQKVSLL